MDPPVAFDRKRVYFHSMTADTATQLDVIALARTLMRAPSVTPQDAGVMEILESVLGAMGFACTRYRFGDVDNLHARLGAARPVFAFAGHVDVVPPGDPAAWSSDPFAAEVRDGRLYGRGAADMKGAIAAFIAAVADHLSAGGPPQGSIAFLITGDEEGPAVDGTVKLMQALHEAGERFDHCLVGEPTNPHRLGETVKIGRRGSLNAVARVVGRQGHVAYPERAENPIPTLIAFLARLKERVLDEGAPHFQPSNLEITSIDVGNPAHNVIPAEASARFNIRFNTAHDGAALKRWIESEARALDTRFPGRIELDLKVTGEAFLSQPGPFSDLLGDAIETETGARPALTTGGGTSDARFIKDYCEVAEFGLVGETMHQVDENVAVEDIERLRRIYAGVLKRYFERMPEALGLA